MKSNRLLDDVNLSDVVFRNSSRGVQLDFLNMQDGASVGSLLCTGVLIFSYHADPEDGLPHYVAEVNHALVPRNEEEALLHRLGCAFGRSRNSTASDVGQFHYVNMESGELLIELVCMEVQFHEQVPAKGLT